MAFYAGLHGLALLDQKIFKKLILCGCNYSNTHILSSNGQLVASTFKVFQEQKVEGHELKSRPRLQSPYANKAQKPGIFLHI